jgi:hypothetical protein
MPDVLDPVVRHIPPYQYLLFRMLLFPAFIRKVSHETKVSAFDVIALGVAYVADQKNSCHFQYSAVMSNPVPSSRGPIIVSLIIPARSSHVVTDGTRPHNNGNIFFTLTFFPGHHR